MQFFDNRYDVVFKHVLKNYKKIVSKINNISNWYQERYWKFISKLIKTLNKDLVTKRLSGFKSFTLKEIKTETNETFCICIEERESYESDSIFFVVEFEFYESRNHYTPRIDIRVLEDIIFFKSLFKKIPTFLSKGTFSKILNPPNDSKVTQDSTRLFTKRTSNLFHIESFVDQKYPTRIRKDSLAEVFSRMSSYLD